MYVLYADDPIVLSERARLFTQYMEPLLRKLEAFVQHADVPSDVPEFRQYLQVCRWPFRQLEYAFALDALLDHLEPGDRFLDAGCGVTPLAHVLAGQGVHAEACDGESRIIDALRCLKPETIYGTAVAYATQDLTATSYADATFDAVSCISVLEHIPAPHDQKAVQELLRILKPGGLLVLTVDFIPSASAGWRHYLRRVADLARQGDLLEIGRGFGRRLRARQIVSRGEARQPRSANQCFQVEHLEQDILPQLKGDVIPSRLPFSTDLRSFTPEHARRLWELQPGLRLKNGNRDVLPAALLIRK